uniref:Putative calcineurin-like phosphoesterase n=1 Tax=viral metagenome TaxID=1070528 RepID=A0A6M3XG62_9ZZZZ
MLSGDIAKKYLSRFGNTSTLQLARMLTKDHPLIFADVEQARACLRYYRGAIGKNNRNYLKDTEFIRSLEDALAKKYNPYGLPEAVYDNWTPVSLPFHKGRGLIIADLHIPYHDVEAITIAIKWGQKENYTDFVLLNGDINDHYTISRFQKDPRMRSFKSELDDTIKLFEALEKAFPKAQIIIKYGNHDNRLEAFLRARAPELLDMQDFIKEEYLKTKERGFITVPHDVPINVGKLNILHGHEIQSLQTVVNPARGAYLKTMECVLLAHCHRTSQHAETSMSGRLDTAWSVGCLCQLHPEYARLNKWNMGMAGLEFNGDDFEIENKRIVNGVAR